jgi:hypothetical protein
MTLRKPLVINSGNIEQLQAGDTLDAPVTEGDVIAMTNGNAGTLPIGTPVYVSAASTVDEAQADAVATSQVLGLLKAGVATGVSGIVQTDGVITATTGEWDTVTGGSGGLVANTVYYLDPDTAGMLTTTAPTDTGDYVVRIGKAISTTELEISIMPPIKL